MQMTEEQAKVWAKDKINQQTVVDRFFTDYPPRREHMAFFMAGIPGAGKTELATNALMEMSHTLVPIEHDKLVEYIDGYRPEDYYIFRKAGSVLVTRILSECLKHGYGFIFDGTLSHPNGVRNIGRTLKAGYVTFVVYVIQDVNAAWRLTQDRNLVTGRRIEKDGFIKTCGNITANLKAIYDTHKDDPGIGFWVFDKRASPYGNVLPLVTYSNAVKQLMGIGDILEVEKALSVSYDTSELEHINDS